MKKRIIAVVAILALLGLAVAAYAYHQTTSVSADKPSCCKKGDSCPMKTMAGHEASVEHAGKNAKTEDSCCDCCTDACPMKKGEATVTTVSATESSKNCCDNCDCCKDKNKSTV